MLEVSNRLLTIDCVENLFGDLRVSERPKQAIQIPLEGDDSKRAIYVVPEAFKEAENANVYHMPFLLNKDGSAWVEANSYLVSLIQHQHILKRPTDNARRVASQLLAFKEFCENEGIDWLDFSGKRVKSRPTYRFFAHLVHEKAIKPVVVNQYTGAVYKFYKWLAETRWYPIELDRVDSVQRIKMLVQSSKGGLLLDVDKRKLTKRIPSPSSVPIGFVREDGEDLRPLRSAEFEAFCLAFAGTAFDVQERLILVTALETGARKQSVLTLRERHIRLLYKLISEDSRTVELMTGPGTGVDTKFDKSNKLQVPVWLVNRLMVYIESPFYKKRKAKFLKTLRDVWPHLIDKFNQDDVYAFLSDQGNCYYMGKSDPRYPFVKTVQAGQMTHYLQKKIIGQAGDKFPASFRFHWLRATFAYRLYKALEPAILAGEMSVGDQISYIQERMHHEQRETTENYLKLFQNDPARLSAQNKFEGHYSDELSILLGPDNG